MPLRLPSPAYRPPVLMRIGLLLAVPVIALWLVLTAYFGGQGSPAGTKAAEFQGIHQWLNSQPLTLAGLQGKVVLVDFWTYTCVNCIRTFPYLKDWYARYADDGLVIVGMHSPEFEFEKITENVAASSQKAGLLYPIAQDNDFATWNAYGNRFWPAKYLIDKDGVIRYTHFGEGRYKETEEKIRDLLAETGASLEGIPLGAPEITLEGADLSSRGSSFGITRELYGGYIRNNSLGGGYVANEEYYDGPERLVHHTYPGGNVNDEIYLQGPWFSGLEALNHAGPNHGLQDYLGLRFTAATVNAVVNPAVDDPIRVLVTLDGRPLSEQDSGIDIQIEDGTSFFTVDQGRLYNLVSLAGSSNHELRLAPTSGGFALFAFTFGG